LEALKVLAGAGIETRIAMMPILPFIEDTEANITTIVRRAHECGVGTIIPWFGMSLRDRQRAYYYRELDESFPGLRREYEQTFGDRYQCASPNADRLVRCARSTPSRRVSSRTRLKGRLN
jgi:DNA repair photolyase